MEAAVPGDHGLSAAAEYPYVGGLSHPSPVADNQRARERAGAVKALAAGWQLVRAGLSGQVNNSSRAAAPTGLIRYRSIPASRASSRPGCALLAVNAISLKFRSCGCCESCRATA
jgi:hypothetical protein